MVVRDCPLGMHICQLIFSIPVPNSVLSDNFFSIFFFNNFFHQFFSTLKKPKLSPFFDCNVFSFDQRLVLNQNLIFYARLPPRATFFF